MFWKKKWERNFGLEGKNNLFSPCGHSQKHFRWCRVIIQNKFWAAHVANLKDERVRNVYLCRKVCSSALLWSTGVSAEKDNHMPLYLLASHTHTRTKRDSSCPTRRWLCIMSKQQFLVSKVLFNNSADGLWPGTNTAITLFLMEHLTKKHKTVKYFWIKLLKIHVKTKQNTMMIICSTKIGGNLGKNKTLSFQFPCYFNW